MAAPTPPNAGSPVSRNDAVAVISATGAFRLLLILLTIWTFFEGFALFFGVSALSLGGSRTAEQVVGAQMIVMVPVYALLIWRREHYRLLIWIPYGAQLAIAVPIVWGVLFRGELSLSRTLLLVVSATFFAMLFYFWWHSHPLDFFAASDEEEYDEEDEEDEEDTDDAELDDTDDNDGEGRRSSAARRAVRPRDVAKKPGRFRRRDS